MAIDINSVYAEVLNIIKNEDREKPEDGGSRSSSSIEGGRNYITPNEFNSFAERAQLDVFESAVYDFKKAILSNETDNAELIKEKVSPFILEKTNVNKTSGLVSNSPYWIIKVYDLTTNCYYEEVDLDYFNKVKAFSDTWTKVYFSNGGKYYIYYREDTNSVGIHPTPSGDPQADIITYPTKPFWGSVSRNGTVSYSSELSTNFSLHKSERGTLINKILLREPLLSDSALRSESTNVQDKIE